MADLIRKLCTELDCRLVDLVQAYKRESASGTVLCFKSDPIHPNVNGARIAGENLGAKILELILFPV